jgi:hypothetical protein
VLWGLSKSFLVPIFGGIAIPGYMMWAAILYALLGSWLTYLIGRPLVRVNFELERYNADFRYRMTRIRENAESIALYRGEEDEERPPARRLRPHLFDLARLHEIHQAADGADRVLRAGRVGVSDCRRRAAVLRRGDLAGRVDADRERFRRGAELAVVVH